MTEARWNLTSDKVSQVIGIQRDLLFEPSSHPQQRICSRNGEGALLQHLNMTACFWRHLAIGAKPCPIEVGTTVALEEHCDLIACPKMPARCQNVCLGLVNPDPGPDLQGPVFDKLLWATLFTTGNHYIEASSLYCCKKPGSCISQPGSLYSWPR